MLRVPNSPLDRGLLTDHNKNQLHLGGDSTRSFSLFRDDVSDLTCGTPSRSLMESPDAPQSAGREVRLVDGLSAIANRKGITLAQLCIAWVGALGSHVIPLPGSS
jgi:aryl-alcohol dehydrogenase-like predicted oxidoreductase